MPLPPVDPKEEKEAEDYINNLVINIEKQRQKEAEGS